MRFISEMTADGVTERLFTVGDIHGVLWTPTEAATDRPLILLGHGGGQHNQAPGVVARARRYVTACGFAAAAIDAPGHGDRPRTDVDEQYTAERSRLMAAGEPIGPTIARQNAERAARAVPEWRATLDALQEAGYATGPVGYWGVSMGSAIGIAFVAAEPRIAAAVFGLAGYDTLAAASSSCCSGTTNWWSVSLVSRCSARSPPGRRRCMPTPARMWTSPGSSWTAPSVSSAGTSVWGSRR